MMVQVPPAPAIEPPERLTAPDPDVAPESVPPQVFVAAGVDATSRPLGNVSVKARPVTPPLVAVLVITSVSVVTPVPVLVENDFAIVGVLLTMRLAVADAVEAGALVAVTAPTAMVLLYVAAVFEVTSTLTVHEPLAGIVAPESATVPPAAAAVTVPLAQVVDAFGVAAFTRFAGYGSVNAAPVIAVPACAPACSAPQ